MNPLKVCIEARLPSGAAGGVEQVLIGLAAGLSALSESDESYFFPLLEPGGEWLLPYLKGPCRPVPVKNVAAAGRSTIRAAIRKAAPKLALDLVRRARRTIDARRPIPIPSSDGLAERLGCHLVHFPYQLGYLTSLPTIYHPHDLQHRHLPQYFSAEAIRQRDALYQAFCRQAAMVAVTSTWVKSDLINQYGLEAGKIGVVPLAPVLNSYPTPSADDLAAAQRRFSLPAHFAFYPAQTWPHKNHLTLLRALGKLRDRGQGDDIHLIFSGTKNDFFETISREVSTLGLSGRAAFLGFVTPLELQSLYRLARCVVIPSKFEAASFPLWEAFLAGVPAACSRVTSLPAQAGDAALLFDPDDVDDIAATLMRLWSDSGLRSTLAARGRQNVQAFTWSRTATLFRAHYRRIAGRPLADEDVRLLSAPPLL